MGLIRKNLTSSSITTLEQIERICLNDTIDGKPSYYALQRMATNFKKNKQMDLAIACLRRSNELSDAYDRPPLLRKDYERLISFLSKDNKIEDAKIELNKLQTQHPEFYDMRIGNLERIQNAIDRALSMNADAVFISTNSLCPTCKKYNNKIFSISGHRYPALPQEFLKQGGFDKDCIVGIAIHFDF